MKHAISCVLVFVVAAGSAHAISGGPGGYIYWSAADTSTGSMSQYSLYRLEIDGAFNLIGAKDNFDNAAFNNAYSSWSRQQRFNNLEVLDPRDQGGTGSLLQPTILNDTPPNTQASYNKPWDIVQVDPSGPSQTLLADGRFKVGSEWHTQWLGKAMTAPQGWVPAAPDNDAVALVTTTGIWTAIAHALYDANGNGVIDNDLSEGQQVLYDYDDTFLDAEMGPDDCLYWTQAEYVAWPDRRTLVRKLEIDNVGASSFTTIFASTGPTNPVGLATDMVGLALGGTADAPIVYLITQDNDFEGGSSLAIYALKDGDADDNIDLDNPNDMVSEVWRRGDFGLSSMRNGEYGGEDIEYYINPDNGVMMLFASDYDGKVWALELADNGLTAVDGVMVQTVTNGGPNGYSSGFEIDMNPVGGPIPGDSNGDGKVDGGDLAIWQQNYDPLGGGNNTFALGDWNGDGKIDGGDLALWQQNYDPIGPTGADGMGANVPEPATLLLLGTGLAGACGVFRRRRMK